MKQFANFYDAISYHSLCPICDRRMNVLLHGNTLEIKQDNKNFLYKSDNLSFYHPINNEYFEVNLSEGVDSYTDDILHINTSNNQAYLEFRYKDYSYDEYHKSDGIIYPAGRYFNNKINYDNITLFESMMVSCYAYHTYYYLIQLRINFHNDNLAEVEYFLNSDFYHDENTKYSVHNNYATGQTELFPDNIIIPIIDLNLKNPQETIDRIKKLALFS